ncbi:unnamed protein product [Linum tenue]|uniref:Secreted protein n=1 Tax=Linum tenue TaxID=586396 RepID=A0AAV0LW96_9ROSI|nr:unnamed protein product [Linum tenue]
MEQLVPCLALAVFIHPTTSHNLFNRIFWAFCVYLESVSVLPQLRVMQNTKVQFDGLQIFLSGVWGWKTYSLFLFLLADC